MAILTQPRLNAEFLISEANDWRSRDEVTVSVPDGGYETGTILGKITASGKYVRHNAAAVDGSEAEAGILLIAQANGSGAAADADCTIIARDAEVEGDELTYEVGADAAQITTSNTALAALGIIVR